MPFHNILVPVDFDETSVRAIEQALMLAKTLDAKITVLHVYSLPVYNFPDGSYVPAPEVVDSIRRSAGNLLDAFLAKKKHDGVAMSSILREGRTADEICKATAEIGADLIVMGTHGRGLVGRTLLGSVAETVLRQATVPVMTVHTA